MKEQERIACTLMRGGTSRAVFFKKSELPSDPGQMEKVINAIFGNPDPRQIDGLGGAYAATSKVAIIGASSRPDADVDYTFGQIRLDSPRINWAINCGNISSAVGPYAIDEGMVPVTEPFTTVRIHNTNTGKVLLAKVEVRDGRAAVDGDFAIDSIPGTGALIELDYKLTFGSATGKLLPTGSVVDILDVEGYGPIPVSIVDIANSVVFVKAEDLGCGCTGKESRPDMLKMPEMLDKLEAIRAAAAVKCGFVARVEDADTQSRLRPFVAFVAPADDYVDYATGETIKKETVDFLARMIFDRQPGETFAGTASICTAVASQIEGTVVNQVCSERAKETGEVHFGHPRGINIVHTKVSKSDDGFVVEKAVFPRTARRLMDGIAYVKKSVVQE